MGNVAEADRRTSKSQFDETYFKIHRDCVKIINNGFGGKETLKIEYAQYIASMTKEVLATVFDIGRNIRIANSIFPTCKAECEEQGELIYEIYSPY